MRVCFLISNNQFSLSQAYSSLEKEIKPKERRREINLVTDTRLAGKQSDDRISLDANGPAQKPHCKKRYIFVFKPCLCRKISNYGMACILSLHCEVNANIPTNCELIKICVLLQNVLMINPCGIMEGHVTQSRLVTNNNKGQSATVLQ